MKRKFQIIAYALVVTLYVLIFVGASLKDRQHIGKLFSVSEESCVFISTDSLERNWLFILPENPMLQADSKDTLVNKMKRYNLSLLPGLEESKELPVELLIRTDRFSDFISRFNGDSVALDQFKDKLDYTLLGELSEREGHILALVNSVNAHRDSVLRAFAEDVIDNHLQINDGSKCNYLAVATFAYKDVFETIFPVRLTFQQAVVEDAPIWYICKAESPYFTFGDADKPYYIDLFEREVKFMGLGNHVDRSAESLGGSDFKSDAKSAYLILASKGFITYQYSDNVQYICKIGNYIMLIEKVENYEHRRSGFLITKIVKNDMLIFENRPFINDEL